MAADIHLGAVYYEDATDGVDSTPDKIDVSWTGGPADAQLTTLTINMDKDGNGVLDPGEPFFDTDPGGLGVFGNSPLQLTTSGFTILSATPLGGNGVDWDGATGIVLTFSGFTVGQHLTISVDLDEQGVPGDASPLVEGNEFQYSTMSAGFTAPNYLDSSGSDVFLDFYPDDRADLAGVPRDNYFLPPDPPVPLRTAGAFIDLTPIELASIKGRVHADTHDDCIYNPAEGDVLLSGVTIELLDDAGNVVQTTLTDANGEYAFLGLLPGTYSVRETQPTSYFDDSAEVGTIDGITVGTETDSNNIGDIVLASGSHGVDYDFCEHFGQISGRVHADTHDDCNYDPSQGDQLLSGVTIELLDNTGTVIATTTTDVNGEYHFTGLLVGTYSVHEIQPTSYFDGDEEVGEVDGVTTGYTIIDDEIDGIDLIAGRNGTNYDFCEHFGSISGMVHVDVSEDDCNYDPTSGDFPVAGVTIELLDAGGTVIATTTTDANGQYSFNQLLIGTYSVHEVQPVAYFSGDTDAGTINGIQVGTAGTDRVDDIVLAGIDRHGVNYDFCEHLGSIAGRVIVDVNSNDTVDAPKEQPIQGVTIELIDAAGNVVATTTTDADGRYLFDRLQRGTYSVRETQPSEWLDNSDYVGTINGVQVGVQVTNDVLESIALLDGRHGVNYDFTESPIQPPFIVVNPPGSPAPFVAAPLFAPPPPVPVPTPIFVPIDIEPDYYSSGIVGYTWHLSVVNGGQPRTTRMTQSQLVARAREISELTSERPDWDSAAVRQGRWTLRTGEDDQTSDRILVFGVDHAFPVVGDFNGDGNTDVGVFRNGAWFIDLNGNGKWDEGDLWAKLGHRDDLPVTGDWDGDGKADIAIFGRAWPGDPRAIAAEPGLPSDINAKHPKAKNLPPLENESTLGIRALQFTSAGKVRTDLIDHVFLYGWGGDVPISGDWTGEGQEMIGIFRDGAWKLDLNGDGIYDEQDRVLNMGEPGDKPVIGDFNGDTRVDLGIYRNGLWHIDTNNDGLLDARDRAFTFGDGADLPVVGDWDGDGVDDPGLYRNTGPSGS